MFSRSWLCAGRERARAAGDYILVETGDEASEGFGRSVRAEEERRALELSCRDKKSWGKKKHATTLSNTIRI